MDKRIAIGVVAAALAATSVACSSDKETRDNGTLEDPGHDNDPGILPVGGFEKPGVPVGTVRDPPPVVIGNGGSGGAGGTGGTGSTGGTGGALGSDPWPTDDVRHFGAAEGLPGRVTGIGVDDAQNVYVIDGSAVYALKAGGDRFVRTSTGGQFDLSESPSTVCGGADGKVYVGYFSPNPDKAPELLTEEEKLQGDLDRFSLNDDGTLAFEFHHRIQNSSAKWMDHTRTIFDCARVVGGPNHGDLYVGSNHGVTVIRGDAYADHRHSVWASETGSLAIGYVWGVNTDKDGNLLLASYWKLAALPPAPLDDLMGWLDHQRSPWLADTYAQNLGSQEDPDDLRAIAGDVSQGRIYVGSYNKGLSAMDFAPRKWWAVEGTPDSRITSLELDPTDGKLWVGTGSSGLWRYDPAANSWEKIDLVPGGMIHDIYMDTTISPRAIYVGTNSGLYVIRAP